MWGGVRDYVAGSNSEKCKKKKRKKR